MSQHRGDQLAGAVAAGGAIAASVSFAWALHASTNPVLAVASYVRDHTPGSIAVPLIHLVGHADKPLLVATTTVLVVVIGVLIGGWWRTRMWLAVSAIAVFTIVGIAAVASQPHGDSVSAASAVIGAAVWLALLNWLTRSVGTDPARVDRRALLQSSAIVVGLSLIALKGAQWIDRGQQAVAKARQALRLPATSGTQLASAEFSDPAILPWRTPNDDFYTIHTALEPPAVDPASWKLRIHGLVDREITLTYDDLVARQFSEGWVTLCCVSNEVGGDLIGNAWWSGVRVADLLAQAGVHPEADAVLQTSYDGWTCGTPLKALTDDRLAMLAVAMNGEPLPVDHGFPVRTVVPGLYGFVSACKWVVDLEVTRFDRFSAYWTDRGWSAHGPVKTESRIVVPGDGAGVKAGRVPIGGVAWAQHTGIAKVEVQVDGGPWQVADLGGVPSDDTWVQWRVIAQVGKGNHHIAVRATDKSGYTQTAVRADVVPDGATGWHTISFSAT